MNLDDAIRTLSRYNRWRTGEDERTMDEAGIVPADITESIKRVLLWYEAPEPYALELIRRMLTRLQEAKGYSAICAEAESYLGHNTVITGLEANMGRIDRLFDGSNAHLLDPEQHTADKSELIEPLGATLDYEGISGKLADENIRLRKAAESLWDGVTDVLSQTEIDRVERMYKAELTLLLGSP